MQYTLGSVLPDELGPEGQWRRGCWFFLGEGVADLALGHLWASEVWSAFVQDASLLPQSEPP